MAGAPPPTPTPPTPGPGGGGGDLPTVDLTPILGLLTIAWGALEIAGILPDPISLLLSAFAGRPREQATVEIANRLVASPNPAAKLLGIEWLKAVHNFDLVISESGTGVQIIDAMDKAFTDNLVAQGVSLGRARTILVNAYSRAAQDGAPLEPELRQSLASNLILTGPQNIAGYIHEYQLLGEQRGLTGDALNRFVLRNLIIQLPVAQLLKITIQPNPQNTPPPNQPPGPPPIIPPFPPPIPPQPGGGDGDELTDCCDETQTALGNILNAIEGLNPGGGTVDPTCCANVVAAINAVATALGSLTIGGGGGGGSVTVDLSGVVGELAAIATAIAAVPPGQPIDLTQIVAALESIATAIGNFGDNLGRIASDLDVIASTADPDSDAVVREMIRRGVLDPVMGNLILGQG